MGRTTSVVLACIALAAAAMAAAPLCSDGTYEYEEESGSGASVVTRTVRMSPCPAEASAAKTSTFFNKVEHEHNHALSSHNSRTTVMSTEDVHVFAAHESDSAPVGDNGHGRRPDETACTFQARASAMDREDDMSMFGLAFLAANLRCHETSVSDSHRRSSHVIANSNILAFGIVSIIEFNGSKYVPEETAIVKQTSLTNGVAWSGVAVHQRNVSGVPPTGWFLSEAHTTSGLPGSAKVTGIAYSSPKHVEAPASFGPRKQKSIVRVENWEFEHAGDRLAIEVVVGSAMSRMHAMNSSARADPAPGGDVNGSGGRLCSAEGSASFEMEVTDLTTGRVVPLAQSRVRPCISDECRFAHHRGYRMFHVFFTVERDDVGSFEWDPTLEAATAPEPDQSGSRGTHWSINALVLTALSLMAVVAM